jgi:hypothetical protein
VRFVIALAPMTRTLPEHRRYVKCIIPFFVLAGVKG